VLPTWLTTPGSADSTSTVYRTVTCNFKIPVTFHGYYCRSTPKVDMQRTFHLDMPIIGAQVDEFLIQSAHAYQYVSVQYG
jgi:hypothetical protein